MAFTFFFRDMSILDLIGQHVVPAVSGFTRVRVWDAGCAMGPEPYSLAIVTLPMLAMSWFLLFAPPSAKHLKRVGWTMVVCTVTSAGWMIVVA